MNDNQYYYAFISYKRKDEKWAKWVQRKLESYKLPAVIREKNPNAPKYMRPIFRDKTDLSGGVLAEQLKAELMRSKYLIVICSPSSAQSEWVSKEVQTFIDEGRQEQIIPFIVDGTPHASNTADECLPVALRQLSADKELLGINVKEAGKSVAFIRLVATMLGLPFDTLWQRHRRQVQKQRIACCAAAVLLCALGIFTWDYNRSTYAYFADYVDCYGVPEGVIPLTDAQGAKRNKCFQFEYRRIPFGEPDAYSWRIHKVSYVNSALTPQEIEITEWQDRYPIMELEYHEETGEVARINYCDTKGKVLLRHVLSERDGMPAMVADFIASREQQGTGFIGASLTSLSMGQMDAEQRKSNIVRYVYERDENGYIVKQTYHSNNDYQLSRSAVSDADGIFGKQYTLDSLGRRIRVEYLGLEGEKACTKISVAGYMCEYEPHGNISKTSYFNLKDSLVLCEFLYAIGVNKINADGNIEEEYYYGTSGEPCRHKGGVAKVTFMYDKRGNQIETAYFDEEGKPCRSNEGVAKVTFMYDKRGNCEEKVYFDEEGKPCRSKRSIAKATFKYDKKGNCKEQAFFDEEGKPCKDKNDVAKWTAKYDERGNCEEEAFFDEEGKPCRSKEGIAKATFKYDKRGNCEETAYFDEEGKPCRSNEGVAKATFKYDPRGNCEKKVYFDEEGKPCRSKEGIAKATFKYSERGIREEEAYFDEEGEPCRSKEGIAKMTFKYDERGNQIETAYFDEEGKPCRHNNGIAKATFKYDKRGNRIEEAYFDEEGKPCKDKNGVAKWTAKYDERGNREEEAYFDEEGKPCKDKNGVAKWTTKYDEIGNWEEEAYFDEEGKPCRSKEGIAKMTVKYDERENIIETACFDEEGKPCRSKEGIAKATFKYDEKGNREEEAYFDEEGKPCKHNNGIVKATFKYDMRGNRIEGAYFDEEGKPCRSKEGIAKATFKYDMRGNMIETACFDEEGEPCRSNDGYAKATFKYDERNTPIEVTLFDEKGNILNLN